MDKSKQATNNPPPKPNARPEYPFFSPGPTAKRPGWTVAHLEEDGIFGELKSRSHRSAVGRHALNETLRLTREILHIPAGHEMVIVGGSDTGAVEAAIWNFLGPRPVTSAVWDRFAEDWSGDVENLLKNPMLAPYGDANGQKFTRIAAETGTMPPFAKINFDHDVVFAWNSTTTGVQPKNGDWIPAGRGGLTLCDATSSVFVDDLPWDKLDITCFSWQKGLGSEAQHGTLVLSPRAIERLKNWTPVWVVPKLFQLKTGDVINPNIFKGEIKNTPSMMAVADYLDALHWARDFGGMPALQAQVMRNYQAVKKWVDACDYLDFTCRDESIRSPQSLCLAFTAPWFTKLDEAKQRDFCQKIHNLVGEAKAGYDFSSYPSVTPPGLRFWGGPTIRTADLQAVLPWIDWAVAVARQEMAI